MRKRFAFALIIIIILEVVTMAGSFTGGGGTLVNAGYGNAANAQTGQVVTTAQSQAQANARAAALRAAAMRGRRGQQGATPPTRPQWNTDRAPQNVPQLPAWNPSRAPQNVPQIDFNTARAPQNVIRSIFGPRTTTFTTRPANVATRMVRTGEGTGTTIINPNNEDLPTGTFFSGGSTPPTEELPTYPTGTFFAADGTLVRGPGYIPPTETTTTDSPFTSYYTGWKGGGGGGGYDYGSKIPSWLLNLYNWNFKG